MNDTRNKYAVVGGGPSGLATVRNMQKYGVPCQGFEFHSDVGGLWAIENPMSPVYKSAHLISSKKMTEFHEFPMNDDVADFPSHQEIKKYFEDFADHYDLRKFYHFNTKVISTKRTDDGLWEVEYDQAGEIKKEIYKGIVLCNGTFNHPNTPNFKGQEEFEGEIVHSSIYKDAKIFEDKDVLIVGAGNTGCDVAVDAVHFAKSVDMSVRRGYYFIPKYVFGKPMDMVGGKTSVLPGFLKTKINGLVLKTLVPDPVRFGFPKPDYKMFESHPVVNSLILHHLGHGDLKIKKDIDYLKGKSVYFKDGSSKEYDMVMCATGYKLTYPFVEKKHLSWPENEMCPQLHLNIFHPSYDNLFIVGMLEATGVGWQGRYDQAELVALYCKNIDADKKDQMKAFVTAKNENTTDLSNGMNYLKLARMAFYVHKETYVKMVKSEISHMQSL